MYKIIGADQKEYGPITADQMIQWIAQRRVTAQTQVQFNGGEWKPLADYPEFAVAFSPPAQPSGQPALNVPPPAGRPKTSGLAVASLVLGILGIFSCGFTAIIGLILGIVGMNRIRKSNGTLEGHGLALAGTIISAVFILMVPMGAAMFLPAVAKAKQRANTIVCENNMKQLALGVRLYSSDHNGHFPPAATWCDAIKPEVGAEKVFLCPQGDPTKRCSYAYNARLDGLDEKTIDPETVLFFETDGGWNVSGGPELTLRTPRHGGVYIVAFADGSVQPVTGERFATLRWNP